MLAPVDLTHPLQLKAEHPQLIRPRDPAEFRTQFIRFPEAQVSEVDEVTGVLSAVLLGAAELRHHRGDRRDDPDYEAERCRNGDAQMPPGELGEKPILLVAGGDCEEGTALQCEE